MLRTALVLFPMLLTAEDRFVAGFVGGVATLSADARFVAGPPPASSGYKPENGPSAMPFFGVHLNDWFTLQAGYLWSRNDVRFNSLRGLALEDRPAQVTQHMAVADALLYFRSRREWARPYLSFGTGIARLASDGNDPLSRFQAFSPLLHVAVGIDLKMGKGWRFRYTFGETIQRNDLSRRLSPAGERNLAGFRNLFGFAKYF